MAASSSDVNHKDQPTDCFICGKACFKTKQTIQYHYDDTKAKRHWTAHSACLRERRRAAA